MTRDMTQGNPLKLILSFFLPVVMGNLFQQLYNVVDTVIVGRYVGVGALAAVGSTGSLNFLVMGFAIGLCGGFGIPLARYFGAKDMPAVRRCIANLIYLSAAIAVLLTVLVLAMTRTVLVWMHTPQDIFDDAYRYIIVIFAGIGVTMAYNLLAAIARAVGDSRTPLYFLIVAAVLNILLDLLFVLVFGMGTAGVGYATVLAQAISAVCCFVYMYKKFPMLHLTKADMAVDGAMIRYLLNMGFPMALQYSITAIGTLILQTSINRLGSGVVAAVTASMKVLQLVQQPMEALAPTMATYTSQNWGAKQLGRVRQGVRCALWLSLVFGIVLGVFTVLAGPSIARLFLSDPGEEILLLIRRHLLCNSAIFALLGTLLTLRNSIQGLGYTYVAMASGLFELVARAIVGMVFVDIFGFWAVCFANAAAWIAANILLVPLYQHIVKLLQMRMGENTRYGGVMTKT